MPEAAVITIDEQIECVDREIKMREVVYPRWVNKHPPKMTPQTMDKEMARIRAVRETLLKVRAGDLVPAPHVNVT